MTMTKEQRAVERERWRVLIADFGSKEQTVKSFCAERGEKYYSFKYWQKILRRESLGIEVKKNPSPKFRELPLGAVSGNSYGLELRNGRKLTIDADFTSDSLRKLISLLESC
jgi:hypothetical protein